MRIFKSLNITFGDAVALLTSIYVPNFDSRDYQDEIRFNAPCRADENYNSTGTQRRDGFACHLCGFTSTARRK